MKKKVMNTKLADEHFGLVANGVAGSWSDTETNQRCFFLISTNAGFRARLRVERNDIENVAKAFDQVRDELRTDGMLPAIST